MMEDNVEQLDYTEQLEDTPVMVNNDAETIEKIEIVEHVESKYDNVVPRTEMGEMTKQEKEEIRSKVLGEDIPPAGNETIPQVNTVTNNQGELAKPGGNSLLKILIFLILIVAVLAGVYIFVVLPNM